MDDPTIDGESIESPEREREFTRIVDLVKGRRWDDVVRECLDKPGVLSAFCGSTPSKFDIKKAKNDDEIVYAAAKQCGSVLIFAILYHRGDIPEEFYRDLLTIQPELMNMVFGSKLTLLHALAACVHPTSKTLATEIIRSNSEAAHAKDENGFTPLRYCTSVQIAKELLHVNPKAATSRETVDGMSALHSAARFFTEHTDSCNSLEELEGQTVVWNPDTSSEELVDVNEANPRRIARFPNLREAWEVTCEMLRAATKASEPDPVPHLMMRCTHIPIVMLYYAFQLNANQLGAKDSRGDNIMHLMADASSSDHWRDRTDMTELKMPGESRDEGYNRIDDHLSNICFKLSRIAITHHKRLAAEKNNIGELPLARISKAGIGWKSGRFPVPKVLLANPEAAHELCTFTRGTEILIPNVLTKAGADDTLSDSEKLGIFFCITRSDPMLLAA